MTRQEKIDFIARHWELPDPTKLIVMEDVAPKEYRSGSVLIHIPETSQSPPTSGVVVKLGADVKAVKGGDKVIFARFSGNVLEFGRDASKEQDDNLRVRVLAESEILLVVSQEFVEEGYQLKEAVV